MASVPKDKIVETYKRLVKRNDGKKVGERIFMRETGFSHHFWKGGYWRSWSAFQEDAGFIPNQPNDKIPDEYILKCFAELALELGQVPSEADIMLKRKEDHSVPSKAAFRRWGSRNALYEHAMNFCEENSRYQPVLQMLRNGISNSTFQRIKKDVVKGFVYLIRSGKSYKVGKSNAVGRRLVELSIQLPQKPDTIHVIETDDPDGIELYWHRRFAEKRERGEWFRLNSDDIEAFKRRKYQ